MLLAAPTGAGFIRRSHDDTLDGMAERASLGDEEDRLGRYEGGVVDVVAEFGGESGEGEDLTAW